MEHARAGVPDRIRKYVANDGRLFGIDACDKTCLAGGRQPVQDGHHIVCFLALTKDDFGMPCAAEAVGIDLRKTQGIAFNAS